MKMLLEQEASLYHTLLLEYACGALDDNLSLLMATHLTLSPAARRSVSFYECLGGALIEEGCAPVSMNKASLKTVLDQLGCPDAAARCNPAQKYIAPPGGIPLPQPLCRFLKQESKWRRIYPGIEVMLFPAAACSHEVRLYRFGPGRKAPRHRHNGMELTLILDGSLHDEAGSYGRGDLLVIEPEASHSPRACKDEGCLCLVATPGHTGWLGLLERLFGF
jgi:putative transcriptional regulator